MWKRAKPVVRCDRYTGEPIERFKSITQASLKFDIGSNSICRVVDHPTSISVKSKWVSYDERIHKDVPLTLYEEQPLHKY